MTKIKDFIALVKEGLLLILFLLLLFFPSYINNILIRAGFTEGSLMGLTWKQKAIKIKEVADSSQQLAINASLQMEQLQERLDSISKKLLRLTATTDNPAVEHITAAIDSSKAELKFSNMQLKRNVQFQNKKLDFIFKDALP